MDRRITLGYGAGYWSAGPPAGALEGIKEAERLGFDSVWTAEAYGSDALTPLAWWGAHTERLRLGTGIIQLSARTPAATAMAAITLDHLSGGRVHPGPRRIRPAGRRGLVRPALPPPAGPHAGVRRHHPPDRRTARSRSSTTASSTTSRCRAGPDSASPSSRRSTRCARRSRSSSPPRARRTSPWPPRSPTAGSRCSSPRRRTASTASAWPRASPRPATRARPTGSRSSPTC